MGERDYRKEPDPIPRHVVPMRPSSSTTIPQKEEPMLVEPKYDGWRIVAKQKEGVWRFSSKEGISSYNEWFVPVLEELSMVIPCNAILDGEMVVLDKAGHHQASWVQNAHLRSQGRLRFYVFDILHYDGENLMDETLEDRKTYLASVLPSDLEHVKLVPFATTEELNAREFFDKVKRDGFEGIVMKDPNSKYIEGDKGPSKSWIKIKRLA